MSSTRSLLILSSVVVLAAPPAGAQYLQWTVNPHTDRWYGLVPATTWGGAEAIAQAQNAHLATVGDPGEQVFLARLVDPLPPLQYWIGLNDVAVEGAFAWADGSPVGYTNWAPGEPDGTGDGAVLWNASDWRWRASTTNVNWPGLVERGPRPVAGWSFPWFHPTELLPWQIEVGDVNGDGRQDAVVANFSARSISVFRGTGSSTFAPPTTAQVPGVSSLFGIALAQLTGGPALDVVATMGPGLVVMAGDGAGGFTHAFTLPVPDAALRVIARDLDADGDADIVAANGIFSEQRVSVWLSDGAGGFAPPVGWALPSGPEGLNAGDLDADGDLDLVVTCGPNFARLAVYLNSGAGAFTALAPVPIEMHPGHTAIADFDADGHADLAIPQLLFTRIAWGYGDGTFDFAGPVITTGDSKGWAEPADLDGDGRVDLAITREGRVVELVLYRGNRTFERVGKLQFAERAMCVRAIELGGDARPELVATDYARGALAVFTNLTLDCDANAVDDPTDVLLDPARDLDHDGLIDACETAGAPFCFGDGAVSACPCGPSQPGHGCATSQSAGGRLAATGNASVANDSVQLAATDLTPSSIGLFFQGDAGVNGGLGSAFGDGLRCVTQNVVRLGIRPIAGGVARFGQGVPGDPGVATAGSVPAGGATRFYQFWFRDAQSWCTPATFNLTNAVQVDWGA